MVAAKTHWPKTMNKINSCWVPSLRGLGGIVKEEVERMLASEEAAGGGVVLMGPHPSLS